MRALALAALVLIAGPAFGASLWTEKQTEVAFDAQVLADLMAKVVNAAEVTVEGRRYELAVDRAGTSMLGVEQVQGRLDGDADSFFLLCRSGEGLVALLNVPDAGTYKLDRSGGALSLRPVDSMPLGSCGGGLGPNDLPRLPGGPHPPAQPQPDTAKAGPVADGGSRHDVLIAYTPNAESYMGGTAQILAEAQLSVDVANQAYGNSAIGSELRLVHVVETQYDENLAWEYLDHVNYLYYPDDGQMDELPPLRDRVGADFVSLFIDGRDALGDVYTCGIAPVMSSDRIQPWFEIQAISVISVQCASAKWSFAHEVGHNRGCAHNREDAGIDGAYPYSYGHRFDVGANGYRTVMAYDNSNGDYTRIAHFSNPDIDWAGIATGVPVGWSGEAHNAQTHNQTSALCAGFRAERTFVQFGWTDPSTGLLAAPFATIPNAVSEARDGGHIVLMNGDASLTGTLGGPHTYVTDEAGGVVLGGN